jgi:hypothetical protein
MTLSIIGSLLGCEGKGLSRQLEKIEMKLSELGAALSAVDTQLEKAKAEILEKIDALTVALTDVEIPSDATVALDQLTASAQALDEIVPDPVP